VVQGVPARVRDVPARVKDVPARSKGVPARVKDVPAMVKGVPAMVKGVPARSQGVPAMVRDVPARSKGVPAMVKGVPAMVRDVPARAGNTPAMVTRVLAESKRVPVRAGRVLPKAKLYIRKRGTTMATDYVPKSDDGLLHWAGNLIGYVIGHATAMGIDTGALTPLNPLFSAYQDALEQMADPNHGALDTQRKNEARDALTTELRSFVMGFITYNPKVTDDDRREIGTPIHDKVRTPAPVPTSRPIIETAALDNRQVAVDLRELAGDKRGKPDGVHGAEILYEIRDEPPVVAEDLRHSSFATKTQMVYTFTEAERGKKVYFAARWENARGEKGPWSDVISAIIP
jgi:hypothetical protein